MFVWAVEEGKSGQMTLRFDSWAETDAERFRFEPAASAMMTKVLRNNPS